MKTIVVSDIFGFTPHLEILVKSLSSEYEILDPYNGQLLDFKSESEAYEQFSTACGLNMYTDFVSKMVSNCDKRTIIIGFSVGASAIWNTLESAGTHIIEKAICFYGSRIREKTNLKPFCNTVLVFPKEEEHFSIPELSRLLARTPNVQCINTDFCHGFMNKLSDNFDNVGYLKYLDWLKQNYA